MRSPKTPTRIIIIYYHHRQPFTASTPYSVGLKGRRPSAGAEAQLGSSAGATARASHPVSQPSGFTRLGLHRPPVHNGVIGQVTTVLTSAEAESADTVS